jgi:WhiB family redox-sensing transcriptional regulator
MLGHPEWYSRGDCRGEDPTWWTGENSRSTQAHAARRICSGCPVQAECATYGIENNEPTGIWGGLSKKDRDRLRSKCA